MDLTAFGPYALNVRTNISWYGPRARLIRAYYCANLKAIRYESVSLNRIVADKSQRVIGCNRSLKAALRERIVDIAYRQLLIKY